MTTKKVFRRRGFPVFVLAASGVFSACSGDGGGNGQAGSPGASQGSTSSSQSNGGQTNGSAGGSTSMASATTSSSQTTGASSSSAASGGSSAGGSSSGGGGTDTGDAAAGKGADASGTFGDAGGDASATGSDGGGSSSACPGLVCDDFESGNIDPAKWTILTGGGGAASVQTQRVANGKYALQVHGLDHGSGPNSDDWAHLEAVNTAALKGTTTFGRANMYLSAEALASLHMTVLFAGTNGTGPANGPAPYPKLRRLEAGTYFGGWQPGMDLHDVSPLVEVVSHPSGSWPSGKWVCVEWEFQDQPDQITIWVNGTQTATFNSMNCQGCKGSIYNGMSSGIIGGFDIFAIGFHDWHPTKVFDIFYDDVVLDVKRIGCPVAGAP